MITDDTADKILARVVWTPIYYAIISHKLQQEEYSYGKIVKEMNWCSDKDFANAVKIEKGPIHFLHR